MLRPPGLDPIGRSSGGAVSSRGVGSWGGSWGGMMGDGDGDGGRDDREDRGEGAHTDDRSNSGRFSSNAQRSMLVEMYGMAPGIAVGLK